jgi:hypothetical protein
MMPFLKATFKDAFKDYHSSAEVAAILPRAEGKKPTHPQTVVKWVVVGRKAPDGRIIRLRATRFPSGWKILPEELEAFFAELTAARLGVEDPSEPSAPPAPTTAARRRELERVDRALDAEGLGPDPEPKPTASKKARAKASR